MIVTALAALALGAAPPVRVDAPKVGEPYVSPLRVSGTAAVPFTVDLANWDGLVVAHRDVLRPGSFSFVLRFPHALYLRGTLIVRPHGGKVVEVPLGTRVVSLDGLLGIEPGATPAQVRRAWATKLVLRPTPGLTCAEAKVTAAGMSGTAFFDRGRLGSVWLERRAVTDTGIRVGSPLSLLLRTYGARLTSQPDKYVPGARSYFVQKRWHLRFDVSKAGRVTRIAFGDDSVHLVELCS